ncbi:MAG: redoxin domain-containing protein [Bacteroidota bacterium]
MHKTIVTITVFILLLSSFAGWGQNLQIDVHFKQAAGKEIYLANHYLGNIYAKDTLLLDNEGKGTFSADTLLPQGLYKMFADENNHFDFLLGADQQFVMKNETFHSNTLQVEGSEETRAFAEYTRYLSNLQQKNEALRKKIESATAHDKQQFIQELEKLTAELHRYWDKTAAEFPDAFITKFIKANHVPALDVSSLPAEVQQNDSLLLITRFYFQQEHFWDNFDYTDERFLFTPFYKQKLETWFTKVLYQNYDSIRQPVFEFLEQVKPHKRIFKFAASYFLNSSINSKIMGMDALFVDLARKYYLSGEAFWASEELMEKIKENVMFYENNLIGKTAPDLTLEGIDGQYYNLHQIPANYTAVLIYEPGCSHCKVFLPELYNDVYLPFRDKGFEVYAIYSMDNREEWEGYIAEHNLHDWINVWDEHHVSRFKILYDARTTPGLYLLDENKKIVAKKIPVENLKTILHRAFGP